MELDLRPPWRKRTRRSRRRTTSRPKRSARVRTAVERTFQATADSAQSTRTRAQDLVDEVAGAASRVREMIEDISVLEDLKRLRTEVETLTRRVAALEDKPAPAKPRSSPPRARSPARSARRPRPRRRRHRRSTAKSLAGGQARSTAAKSRSTASEVGPTAAKPRSTRRQAALDRGQEARLLLMASPQFASDAEFRRGDGPDLHDDERRPGDGAGAARRRHAAALRVRRPRHGRQHPRRRGGRGQPALGVVRRRRRGSRRCG